MLQPPVRTQPQGPVWMLNQYNQGGGLRCLFSDRNDLVTGLTYTGREIFMLCRPRSLAGQG